MLWGQDQGRLRAQSPENQLSFRETQMTCEHLQGEGLCSQQGGLGLSDLHTQAEGQGTR